jgi:type IV pilus assembly protein PilM
MLNIFSKSAIGIDVTDSELRLIFLSKKGKGIILEGYNEVPLSPEIVEGGKIVDPKKFSENLKKLIGGIHGNNKIVGDFVSALPEKETFTILINGNEEVKNYDKNDKKQALPEIIVNEIKERIPLSLDEIYFDWQVTDKNKVLLSAAPKTMVDNYTSAFKCCESLLSKIDIKTASTIRAITSFKNINNKVVVSIGDKSSTIILGNNNSIELTISIPFNNSTIDAVLQDKLKLSKSQIKKAKIVCGVNDKKCHGALKEVLDPYLDEISSSIEQVVSYHKNNFPDEKPIDKIILCGEGASLKDLDTLLSKRMNIEAVVGNPFINITKTNNLLDSKKALKFTQAIGMALSGLI